MIRFIFWLLATLFWALIEMTIWLSDNLLSLIIIISKVALWAMAMLFVVVVGYRPSTVWQAVRAGLYTPSPSPSPQMQETK